MYTPLIQRRRRIKRLNEFLSTVIALLIASTLAATIAVTITGIYHTLTH